MRGLATAAAALLLAVLAALGTPGDAARSATSAPLLAGQPGSRGHRPRSLKVTAIDPTRPEPQNCGDAADGRRLAPRLFEGFSADNATQVLVSNTVGEGTGYDAMTRPGFLGPPVLVRAQLRVNRLYSIDPVASTFNIDVFLRLYWNDPRLRVTQEDIPPSNGSDWRYQGSTSLGNGQGPTHDIWSPDIYFGTEVGGEMLNEVVKLTPYTGDIFWSRQFRVELRNQFELAQFPFDSQTLQLPVTSYSYNELELALEWRSEPVFPRINAAMFSSVTWDYLSYTTDKIRYEAREGVPAFEMLLFDIRMSRKTGSYYLKSFLPLGLLVALTAVSYWFSVEAVPERLGLCITLVLTIISFYNSVTAGLPLVNYATQVDWYVFISFIVAFFSLLEVAIIHHLVQRENNHIVGGSIPAPLPALPRSRGPAAHELDMFCRRFILPFWILFNIAILVQLPEGTFEWLWLACGLLIALLLVANLWLMAYYVGKRYSVRTQLEKSAYGREKLEATGEYLAGQIDIGKPGSFRRKAHDFVISTTDRVFRALKIHVIGDERAEGEAGEGEREQMDRRSLDEDLAKAREEMEDLARREALLRAASALSAADPTGMASGDLSRVASGAISFSLSPDVARMASGSLRAPSGAIDGMRGASGNLSPRVRGRKPASIVRVDGIEIAVPHGHAVIAAEEARGLHPDFLAVNRAGSYGGSGIVVGRSMSSGSMASGLQLGSPVMTEPSPVAADPSPRSAPPEAEKSHTH
ncbi:hypothetical protein DFJ74DRAFT_489061 [Hyaloraphidium curvatum]|nr:hypothetical protein DFJ74DRAFT_489061 [Hyaloraphidium curvatum]